MSTFEAKYSGHCEACGYRIEPGDLATYRDDELLHESCFGSPERPVAVCPSCWLTQPCDCEEGMSRHPIHLTERGEWVKTLIEAICAIIVLPVAGAVIIYAAVGR